MAPFPRAAARPLDDVRVLIVEDEWLLAAELEDRLTGLGCAVVGTAPSCESAVAAFERERPDIVLMDIRIKGGPDGVETARRLQALAPTPIIFLTAHTDDETIGRAQEAGAAGYLAKPVRERDLYATITTVLQRHALERRTQELNDLLLEKTRELEVKNRELDEFASVASHDLRAPLRNMLMLLDELVEQGAVSNDVDDLVGRIGRSGRRMQHLVEGLLSLARAGSGSMHRHPVDLRVVCLDAAADLQSAIAEASGTLDLPAASVLVEGDATLLRQLVQNLVSNALKFRRPGVAPVVTLDWQALPSGEVELSVRDNGVGFGPDAADRLFRRFSRLHPGFEGSGIGLATCARIAERHGGAIRAEGEPGRGAFFTVTLPGIDASTGESRGERVTPAASTH